jgi:hypothetical protein
MVSKGVFTQSNFSFKFASSVHPFQTQLYQSKPLSYTLPIFDGLNVLDGVYMVKFVFELGAQVE